MLLYAATFAGGGVLAAFYLFRHKTKHHALLFWVWFFFLLSVFAAAAIAWLSLRAALCGLVFGALFFCAERCINRIDAYR